MPKTFVVNVAGHVIVNADEEEKHDAAGDGIGGEGVALDQADRAGDEHRIGERRRRGIKQPVAQAERHEIELPQHANDDGHIG